MSPIMALEPLIRDVRLMSKIALQQVNKIERGADNELATFTVGQLFKMTGPQKRTCAAQLGMSAAAVTTIQQR